jgi:hypothetical protein
MTDINITEPDGAYNFKNIGLGALNRISGETFHARIFSNNKPLFIQTPKSIMKQGFVKTGKKMYCDLMFTNQDEIFVNWIENLETTCQRMIFDKKTDWFTAEETMDLHDIESSFISLLKLYKSGKYYLIRANVKNNVKIFNESGSPILLDNVGNNSYMITVLEIQGIKFASKNFQIEIEMKQCMVVSPDPFSESCLIKRSLAKEQSNNKTLNTSTSMIESLIDKISDEPEPLQIMGTLGTLKTINTLEPIELDYEFVEEELSKNGKPSKIIKPNKTAESLPNEDPNNFIEDQDTKKNTEINSVTKSGIHLSVKSKSDEDDNSDGIRIHGDIVDTSSLGIIEILKENGTMNENNLKEFNPCADNSLGTITIKKPNQVYYEIYKTALKKAKEIKQKAILAYLDAKNIKKTYMLDDEEDSDSDFDGLSIDGSDDE